jgi:DNA-binding transcriptional ArsR family regulator
VENRIRITDPQVMRALAHPARMAILEELFSGGTGTATELAEVCGLSPSATSYHLRALAKAGLIEEAPGRGDGRERVWRSTAGSGLEVNSGPDADSETQRAERQLINAFLDRDERRVRSWLTHMPQESQEWYEAATLNSTILVATPEELTALREQIGDLVRPYTKRARRDNVPEGARSVSLTYRAFPLPDADS